MEVNGANSGEINVTMEEAEATKIQDNISTTFVPKSVDLIQEEYLEKTPAEELAKIINKYAENFAMNAISIGICLKLARSRIAKGKQHKVWENWIKENVQFSIQTAYKFVKCADYFKEFAPARKFMTAQMFEMLSLKKEDLNDFLETPQVEGKSLENLTKMEMREAVKSWKKAHGYEQKSTNYQYLINMPLERPKEFKTIGIHIKAQDISPFVDILEKMTQEENGLTEDSKKTMNEVVEYLKNKWLK